MPTLMPLPTMMDPRNAVVEFSSVTLAGGSDASPKAYTVARSSGGNSTATARHQR